MILAAICARGDNWHQWRGPAGVGVSSETHLALHWTTNENVRWRAPLPERGNATPIAWADRVFVTQAMEKDNRGKMVNPLPGTATINGPTGSFIVAGF